MKIVKQLKIWLLEAYIWSLSGCVGAKICRCGYTQGQHDVIDVSYPEGLCFNFRYSGRKFSLATFKRELKKLKAK